MEIPVEFKLSVTITAICSYKVSISIPTDWMIELKARNAGFRTVKTAVRTKELTTHFYSPRPFCWLRIVQAPLPGDT
jgi:hypothetical protein